jgi:hypothetical protein
MERRVSVNAEATSELPRMTPDGLPQGWPQGGWLEADASDGPDALPPKETDVVEAASMGQGPCLYLGPAGQRCNRPALAGGFCSVHRPGGRAKAVRNPARVLAAAGAIVALLWPYLEDLVREIIRWTHSH